MKDKTIPSITDDELAALCAEWQKVLLLQHWRFSTSIVRESQLDHEDAGGEILYRIEPRTAIIKLLDPVDYQPGPFEEDMEVTLVHEMLHCHFAPFMEEADCLDRTAMEQAIVAISGALVSLKRGTK